MEKNNFLLYKTAEGAIKVDVLIQNESLWLTQKMMATLFDCSSDNISLHLKNIYESGELEENATTEDFSVVRKEGNRPIKRKLNMIEYQNQEYIKPFNNFLYN